MYFLLLDRFANHQSPPKGPWNQRFDWRQGDSFVVPLWYAHRHTNSSSDEAILFSMSDAPALKALDLYREEF